MCTTVLEMIEGMECKVTTYCNTCPEALERAAKYEANPMSAEQEADMKAMMLKVLLRDMAEDIGYDYTIEQVEEKPMFVVFRTIREFGNEPLGYLVGALLDELRTAACRIPKGMDDTVYNV